MNQMNLFDLNKFQFNIYSPSQLFQFIWFITLTSNTTFSISLIIQENENT